MSITSLLLTFITAVPYNNSAMTSTRRLLEMARRWKKAAVTGRRRMTVGKIQTISLVDDHSKCRGSFVAYTTDEKRFVIPLTYLSSPIMKELFRMSEEEYGLASNRPITFPCNAVLMEYILSMVQRQTHEDVEKALLFLMANYHASSNSCLFPEKVNFQIPICSF